MSAAQRSPFPLGDAREWAWGGATGKGVRGLHHRQRRRRHPPAVGGVQRAVVVQTNGDESDRRRGARATCSATARPAPGSSARSRRTARSTACARSAGISPAAARPARGPALGDRGGLRRHQPQPLDVQGGVRARAARARRRAPTSRTRCSSPRRTTCRSSATRGASRRWSPSGSHSGTDPLEFYANPTRRSSSSLAASRSSSPGSSTATHPRHRQQLRDPAHRRARRSHPVQAPRADAV